MCIRDSSGSSNEALERAMFLNQLPAAVHTALANSRAANNEELALEADNVLEEFQLCSDSLSAPHAIAAVDRPVEVQAMNRTYKPAEQPHHRRQQAELCYVHRRYGKKAYSCRSVTSPMKDQVALPPTSGNGRAGR